MSDEAQASPGAAHPGAGSSQSMSRTTSPLVVPREWYVREQFMWRGDSTPVCLSIDINGKRELAKYAAVMQLHPKLGFIARLGHPTAAAKFQHLHLVDVKRRGATDIHISLGDLAWALEHGQGPAPSAATAPTAAAGSATNLPVALSNASSIIPEAHMETSGPVPVLPASDAAPGAAAAAPDTSSSHEHPSPGAQATASNGSCDDALDTLAAHAVPCDVIGHASITAVPGTTGLCDTSAAHQQQQQGSGESTDQSLCAGVISPVVALKTAASGSPPSVSGSGGGGVETCRCAHCPCHYDADPANAAVEERKAATTPHTSAVWEHQVALGNRSPGSQGPGSGGRPSGLPPRYTPPSVAPTAPHTAPSTTLAAATNSSAAAATGISSHMSRDRLRTLAIPGASSRAGTCLDPAPLSARGKGPGSRTNSASGTHNHHHDPSTAAAALVEATSAAASAVDIIGTELVLPPELTANRRNDQHVLVQYEIDGELEDCQMRYRLQHRPDGTAIVLGVSRPLRGLQLLELSERDGDVFVRAATPVLQPPTPVDGVVAAAAAAAAPGGAPPQVLHRSGSGRQRKPSLKAREGGVDDQPAGRAAGGLPPLPPSAGVSGVPPAAPAGQRRRSKPGSKQSSDVDEDPYHLQHHQQQHNGSVPAFGAGPIAVPLGAKRPRGSVGRVPSASAHSGSGVGAMGSVTAAGALGARHGMEDEQDSPGFTLQRPVTAAGVDTSAGPSRMRPALALSGLGSEAGSGSMEEGEEGDAMEDVATGRRLPLGGQLPTPASDGLTGAGSLRRRARKRTTSEMSGGGGAVAAGAAGEEDAAAAKRARGPDSPHEVRQQQQQHQYNLQQNTQNHRQQQQLNDASRQARAAGLPPLHPDPGGSGGKRRLSGGRVGGSEADPSSTSSHSSQGEESCSEGEAPSATRSALASEGRGNSAGAARGGSSPAGGAPKGKGKGSKSKGSKGKGKPIRHPSRITNVVRNAGAILLMIGHSTMYEKQLRATFGNNPDTSKALRLLEEQGKVIRGGLGYRMHPYHYNLTPLGLEEYERELRNPGPSHAFAILMGANIPSVPGAEGAAAGGETSLQAAAPAAAGQAGASAAAAAGSSGVAAGPAAADDSAPAGSGARTSPQAPAAGAAAAPLVSPAAAATLAMWPQPTPAAAAAAALMQQVPMAVDGPAAGVVPGLVLTPDLQAAILASITGYPMAAPEQLQQQLLLLQHQHQQLLVMQQQQQQQQAAAAAEGAAPPNAAPAAMQQEPVAGHEGAVEHQHRAPAALQPAAAPAPVVAEAVAPAVAAEPPAWVHAAPEEQQALPAGPAPPQADMASTSSDQLQMMILAQHMAMAQQQQQQQQPQQQEPQVLAPAIAAEGATQQQQSAEVSPEANAQEPSQPEQLQQQAAVDAAAAAGCPMPYDAYGAMYSAYPQAAAAAWAAAPAPAVATPAGPAAPAAPTAATATAPAAQPAADPLLLMQLQQQHEAQVALAVPPQLQQQAEAVPVPSAQTQQMPAVQPVAQPQPLPLAVQPQPQAVQVQVQPQVRYVAPSPCGGGWRAEVPSLDGRMYVSPPYVTVQEAMASADLLISKLRPGEPLNVGVSAQDALSLGTLSAEQVMQVLWAHAAQQQALAMATAVAARAAAAGGGFPGPASASGMASL